MAKKQKRISPNEQALLDGIAIIDRHPLFGNLEGRRQIVRGETIGGRHAAVVQSYGYIRLNQDYALQPEEWAFTIAHCLLHLAFGHFDAEKMPGYKGSKGEKTVTCDRKLWNMACDIYVAKFLFDIRFGKPTCPNPSETFHTGFSDELSIYHFLSGNGAGQEADILRLAGLFGTAADGAQDMEGLEHPNVYNPNSSWHSRNEYAVRFAWALAHSVTAVVSEAGGKALTGRPKTPAQLAAQWFVNHYPLLGSMAAGFRVDEDYALCQKEDISIAAVDVDSAVIYVNPSSGLSEPELRFVLAHEYLHAGLQHHRRRQGRDPYLWNVACDYVINGWLVEMGVGEMPHRGLLYDPELKGQSAEQIYDTIVHDLKRMLKLSTFRGAGKGDIMGKSWDLDAPASLDDFYRGALQSGLEYHRSEGRGLVPEGLVQEIRALAMPPIPWDVELSRWFDLHFSPLEKQRSYARPSRRQGSTPDIPRPRYLPASLPENSRTFGVVIDTSGSMSAKLVGCALGAVASFAVSREVPAVRVVFCDAAAYDAGYISPDDIAGRVEVKGRGGTVLQPGVDLLESAKDFPKDGPILIITDAWIEDSLTVSREHAFLIPRGHRLPFRPKGEVFYFYEKS